MMTNGTLPADPRGAAGYYLDRGVIPVPIPRTGNCKNPSLDNWTNLRPSRTDLDYLFPQGRLLNIGLLLGQPSCGLVDIDLDCSEAITVAKHLLPSTGWISGRASRPCSHWWYVVTEPPARAS